MKIPGIGVDSSCIGNSVSMNIQSSMSIGMIVSIIAMNIQVLVMVSISISASIGIGIAMVVLVEHYIK